MEQNEWGFYSALVRWICLTLIAVIVGCTVYYTAIDVRWPPQMEQRYVHAHGGQ